MTFHTFAVAILVLDSLILSGLAASLAIQWKLKSLNEERHRIVNERITRLEDRMRTGR